MLHSWLSRCALVLSTVALAATAAASPALAQFTVQRTSAPIFYTDIGDNPSLSCMYVAYEVTNTSPLAVPSAWVDLGNFGGGLVGLAPGEDGRVQLGSLAPGQSKTAFFYLRATATTAVDQAHDVRVYTAEPPGPPALTQSFAFTDVVSTISASANKVTTVVSGPTPPGLGGIVTITVTGETGTIGGAGILSFTPAAAVSWLPASYEMVGSTITFSGSANAGVLTDSLYYIAPSSSATDYVAQYRFRAVNTTVVPVVITPIGYLSSGAQIKHTDTGNFGGFGTVVSPTNFVRASKLVTPAVLDTGGVATWTVRFTNSAAYVIDLDDIIDRLPAGAIYLAGSASFGGSGIGDPAISGSRLDWGGFFTLPASASRDLVYQTTIPNTLGSYANSALAHIGTLVIDSTAVTTDSLPAMATLVVDGFNADVSILKSAAPNPVALGDTLVYTLAVANAGPDSAHAVTVLDSLAAGSTFQSANASLGTVSESGGIVTALLGTLAPGGSASVVIRVIPSLTGSLGNMAHVEADEADPDAADDTSSTTVTVNPLLAPDLASLKTSDGPFTVGLNGTYTIVVDNTGAGATTGTITVVDTLAAGLTYVAGAGLGWSVNEALGVVTATHAAALAAGDTSAVAITVAVGTAAEPQVVNAAWATTAGDATPGNDAGRDTTTVFPLGGPQPDLTMFKASDATFEVGLNGNYALVVTNTGSGPTTGTITVVDTLAAGLTWVSGAGAGWVVGEALGVVTATHAAALAVGDTSGFAITVAVGATALPSVDNAAVATTTGDTDASDDRGTVTTLVIPSGSGVPDLATFKTSNATFEVGQNGDYTIVVENDGTGATTAAITVVDTLATGLTFVAGAGVGWVVNEALGVVTATRAGALAAGDTSAVAITVAVGAAAQPFVTNAAVASTPGDPEPTNDRDIVTTPVNAVGGGTPDLATVKVSDGPFTVASAASYTITVSNAGTGTNTGTITVVDTLAAGLGYVSASGPGWSISELGGIVTATYPAPLAAGGNASFMIAVAVGPAAVPQVINAAWASTAGDATPGNDAGHDTTTVFPLGGPQPDLATTKSSDASFQVGVNGNYTITLANLGSGATTGPITVVDTLAAGLTYVSAAGAGWSINEALGVITGTHAAALAAGDTTGIAITVAVGPAALPSVANGAVATTAGDTDSGNDLGSVTTPVNAAPATPDVQVVKRSVTPFTVGGFGSYGITVTNLGSGPTTGPIALSDVLPTGLTYVFAAGTGWTVAAAQPVITADYAAGLAPGDSAILLIDVSVDAAALPAVSNTAVATTAGDTNAANDTSTDVTTVDGAPDLAMHKLANGALTVFAPGSYRLTVHNHGSAPSVGTITVTDSLPAGLTFVSGSGAGWTVSEALGVVTATTPGPIAVDDSASFTLSVTVDLNALPAVTNSAVASGGGDNSPGNNRGTTTDAVGGTPDVATAKSAVGTFLAGSPGTYRIAVTNVGTAATTGTTVVRDTLAAGLGFLSGTGAGWTIGAVGPVVTATHAGTIAAGDSAAFTLDVSIGLDAYPTVANAAVATTPGDANPTNDRGDSGPVAVALDAQLALEKTAGVTDAEVASVAPYTLRVRNTGTSPVPGVTIEDALPVGFRYVAGSTRLDGMAMSDPAGAPGPSLEFAIGTIAAGGTRTLQYLVRIDAAALYGDGVNRAVAVSNDAALRSNSASARILLRGGVFTDEGLIAGKVWMDCDCDSDRVQDAGELGIPGVRVYLEDGRSAITDVEGKYVFPDVSPRLHVVKIDRSTLPAGSRLTTIDTRNAFDPGTRFVDLKRGELGRADFAEGACTAEALAEVKARRELGEVRAALAAGQPTAPADLFPGATRALIGTPLAGEAAARVEDGVFHEVQPDGSLDAANSRRVDTPGQAGLLTTHIPGATTLSVTVPRSPAPADGRTLVPVTVRTPGEGPTRVTLESGLGTWRVADLDPKLDGVQSDVHGSATFLLIAPETADRATIRVTRVDDLKGNPDFAGPNALRDADEVTTSVAFVPAVRPWVAAGVLNARLDSRSLENSELAPGQVRDRFDEVIDDLAESNDDGTMTGAGRGAVFLKGGLDEKTLVTFRYDSEKANDKRRFDDIRPDEGYPIFGDASIPGFETQSTDRLFARIDRDRSHLMYGDFLTPSAGPTRTLGAYVRSLNGAKAHLEEQRFAVDAFASHERDRQVVEEVPGLGISGPYALSNASALIGSERIEIVTRDRNNPSVILDRRTVTRFADYTIEPYTGRLLFRQPVPSVDERLNPVSIRMIYEVEGGGDRFWTMGATGSVKPVERIELSGSAVQEDDPTGERTYLGAGGTLAVTPRTFLTGEWASSEAELGDAGSAWRGEVRHRSERFDARGFMVRTDAGFDNPSSGFAPDREEAGAAGRFALDAKTAISGEGVRTKDRATGGRRKGAILGLERRLGGGFLAELGYRWARESALPALGGPVAITPNEVDALRGRLAAQFNRRTSAYLEYEKETGSDAAGRFAVGGDVRVTDHVRLYGRHEMIDAFPGPYALAQGQELHTTVIGFAADGVKDLTAFSEYRARDAFGGRRAEAAVGLRNRWALSRSVRLDASFERVNPLEPDSKSASSVTSGFEWIGDPRTKGSARAEYRSAASGNQWLLSAALARKLSRDWTGLIRTTRTWAPGGDFVNGRGQLALAWRETDRNRVSLLARLDHRYDQQGSTIADDLERDVLVASLHANVHPSRPLTVTGQVASKWAKERIDGTLERTEATLLGGRAMYELSPRWDVAFAARALMSGSYDRRNEAIGGEVGFTPLRNLRVAGGFNAFGFKDPDIPSLQKTDRGAYVDVGFKFDEMLFGGGDKEAARGAAQPSAIAVDPASAPAAPVPPARPDSALHATPERISDEAIARDRRSLDGWEAKIAALHDSTAGPGLKAKGTAWIAYAREAIAAEDRTGAADSALTRAIALHDAVADSVQGTDATRRTRAMAATVPGTPPAEEAPLDADVAALRAHAGAWCIADEIARLEVEAAAIARQGLAEPTQVPCRTTPRIAAARQDAAVARAKADECVKPVPPPVVVPAEPVEPNAEVIEALRGIPSGIHFALNKFTLAPASVAVCKRIAGVLAKYPDVKVDLEGHTDSRGAAEYNRKLSQRRVDAVKAALVKAGVDGGRVTTRFAGAEGLLNAEKDTRELALNRRVDFKYFDAEGRAITAEKQTEDLQIEH